jgi:NAD(P)-dependent dehydrogenase (short-subunit alcohol dehydrogenase family)
MKEKGGSIVINASVNGTRVFTQKGATPYASAKAAAATVGKMAALELAQYHIRVNTICPGPVQTNIPQSTVRKDLDTLLTWVELPNGPVPLIQPDSEHPEGRLTSEEVADSVLFLAGERASAITGTELWVDGGYSLIMP